MERGGAERTTPLLAVAFYALCFVPVYTLLGWFEPMPLFFLLLGLELLLAPRPWGWAGSAAAAALGFLTKLTPILLLPVAVRWLGARLSVDAARREWFKPRHPGNLLRPLLYALIFAGVVVGVGYPLVRANLDLAWSSFHIQSIRPPWQSIWAVLDGFYGYGLVPLDMRNLDGYQRPLWESRLPWGLIGLGFALLYLWLYTRRYDWTQPRTPVALTAVGVILLFLYSKGWSPQFLLWVLVFLALLLPTGRGVLLAILLSLVNFVEANVYLILLPGERWIMVGTVLIRTALLILLAVEFAAQIWPPSPRVAWVQRGAAWAMWAVMLAAVVGAGVGAPVAARAYAAQQFANHPCREALERLRTEAGWPDSHIVTQQPEVWRDLYPWLRRDYTFHVLDGYSPTADPADVTLARANAHVNRAFWWISRDDLPASPTSPLSVRDTYVAQPDVFVIEEQTAGACRLGRMIRITDAPTARAAVIGGPLELSQLALTQPHAGAPLRLVLYWQTAAPIPARYTVFTQLFDPTGALVAQQDNWPVNGLAPTDTWSPGTLIRDPYTLTLPADAAPGVYTLHIGVYDDAGRRPLTLADGQVQDHVTVPVPIPVPMPMPVPVPVPVD